MMSQREDLLITFLNLKPYITYLGLLVNNNIYKYILEHTTI